MFKKRSSFRGKKGKDERDFIKPSFLKGKKGAVDVFDLLFTVLLMVLFYFFLSGQLEQPYTQQEGDILNKLAVIDGTQNALGFLKGSYGLTGGNNADIIGGTDLSNVYVQDKITEFNNEDDNCKVGWKLIWRDAAGFSDWDYFKILMVKQGTAYDFSVGCGLNEEYIQTHEFGFWD